MNNALIKEGQKGFYYIRPTRCEGRMTPADVDILLQVKAKRRRQMLICHLQYMKVIV